MSNKVEHFSNLYKKYVNLSSKIDRLEPSTITQLYKEHSGPATFYPNIGIFFNEFALIYAVTLNSTKKTL
jgi:hypothetical protein